MSRFSLFLIAALFSLFARAEGEEVAVFITIGQSNADGSAFFNPEIDAEMERWYSSEANPRNMKIWYRSSRIENQKPNKIGEAPRWVVDGVITDAQPGWMDLWYRNENALGRTAMNMIHGYGTYSTGTGTDCAQGRRGMEGEFGRTFATAFPSTELYIIKLGASGSSIATWADPSDDNNWNYFYRNMYVPAMTDLLAQGKRPRLAGVWWMQGCADAGKPREYYEECLRRLMVRLKNDLGFPDAKIYVGHVVKPGEAQNFPGASTQFGQSVRDAQDAVAATIDGAEILDTSGYSFQYEENQGGYLHYDHSGVNAIGRDLANRAVASRNEWADFSVPGYWTTGPDPMFVASFGSPEITYTTEGNTVVAKLTFPGFTEIKKSVK